MALIKKITSFHIIKNSFKLKIEDSDIAMTGMNIHCVAWYLKKV